MAAAIEALSDSELRKKLKEYGISEAPVTETTRKIFVKKLRQAMERPGVITNGDFSSVKAANGSINRSTSRANRSFNNAIPTPSSQTDTMELDDESESEEEQVEIFTRTKAKGKNNIRASRQSLPAAAPSSATSSLLFSPSNNVLLTRERDRSASPNAPAALVGLSDGELLKKLAEFGIPAGKINDTTRPILMKKLNHALVKAKKQASPLPAPKSANKASRKSLGVLPSRYAPNTDTEDDESHFIATSTQNEDLSPKSRRRTIATSISDRGNRSSKERSPSLSFSMQHSFSLGDGTGNKSTLSSSAVQTPKASPSLKLSTKTSNSPSAVSTSLSSLATGLRSLFTDQTETSSASFVFKSPSPLAKPGSSVRNRFFEEQEKEPYETGSDTETEQQTHRQPKSYGATSWNPSYANKLPSVGSSLQKWTSSLGSLFHSAEASTPTTSDAKRPALHTEMEFSEDEDAGPRTPIVVGLKTRLSPFGASPAPAPNAAGRIVTQACPASNLKSKKEEHFFTWQFIAIVLPILALLFFVVLGLLYLSAKYSEPSDLGLTTAGDVNVLCAESEPSGDCVADKSLLDDAKSVLPSVTMLLQQRAGAYVCGNLPNGVPSKMSRTELLSLNVFSGENVAMGGESRELVEALFKYVNRNPHKGIKFSRNEADEPTLEAVHPIVSWGCAIQQRLLSLFFIAAFIAGGVCIVYLVQKFTVTYWSHREKMQQEVYQLVEAIIDLLSRHHAAASEHPERETYLAVNHVRDLLIPPSERRSKAQLWDKAVQFLEENESRVRVEVQPIQGEEFRVWRWLPPSTSWTGLDKKDEESVTKPRPKVWQGQAFTTGEGAYNAPPIVSPTPCLKVRNMFDAEVEFGENWPVRTQDAILEKAEGAKILHIAVDRASREGCVYAKCTNQEEAGKVYRALHGWWFDGKLVTVKFLRIERYHERFPDSRSATLPLQPSNNQRLSLQTKYWKSPLEHF